jgi:2-C-methyl-D-erythritol 4-phosphate cytidylyltransferase
MDPGAMRAIGIIPAAGRGRRMESRVKKPYLPLGGKPVIFHTLSAFDRCPLIEGLVVAVDKEDVNYCRSKVVERGSFTKPVTIIPGGEERQDSVRLCLESVGSAEVVVIHDGVRPFLSQEVLELSIKEAYQHGAALVAVPVKDTIKIAGEGSRVVKTLPRQTLWAAQTPQTFRYNLIVEAHRRALREGFMGTDDAMLVERMGETVRIIPGSYDNIKITTPDDLLIAENILQRRLKE